MGKRIDISNPWNRDNNKKDMDIHNNKMKMKNVCADDLD